MKNPIEWHQGIEISKQVNAKKEKEHKEILQELSETNGECLSFMDIQYYTDKLNECNIEKYTNNDVRILLGGNVLNSFVDDDGDDIFDFY